MNTLPLPSITGCCEARTQSDFNWRGHMYYRGGAMPPVGGAYRSMYPITMPIKVIAIHKCQHCQLCVLRENSNVHFAAKTNL